MEKVRECLGWMTNCPDPQSCPQNWLERSVSELPTTIRCHVCNQNVELVQAEQDLTAQAAQGRVAAFPVVPPIAMVGAPRSPTGALAMDRDQPQAPSMIEGPPASSGANAPISKQSGALPAPGGKTWFVKLQSGDVIKVDKETLIVGRSRTCDIVIASAKVSRQHASVTRMNGDVYIEDLGSANGVWCNGEKVTRTKVKPGDVYTISDETLTFEHR